jgi:sulfur carrier protein
VTLTVNGARREAPDGCTVAALIARVGLQESATVVELNARIVERARYATTVLADGDVLELVRFVGGG